MRNLILTLMIWIIAFIAITAGVILTYDWYKNYGVEIKINFDDASGLVPGQSKVIYRGIIIGNINAIDLNEETGTPVVQARVATKFFHMIGKGSKFWIVRPEFGFGGVKNLSAISTGNYVAVEPIKGEEVTEFDGELEDVEDPINTKGLKITLFATSSHGVTAETAVFYKGLKIGEVGELGLAKDRVTVTITVYIKPEFSTIVRKGSYFANVSGFHTELHFFGGSPIDVDSLQSLISGGIALYTPNPNAPVAKSGDKFKMYTSEQLRAMQDS